MSSLTIPRARTPRRPITEHAHLWWCAIRATAALWRTRRRQRTELAGMTEIELRDIGMGHSQAKFETDKPFWRA